MSLQINSLVGFGVGKRTRSIATTPTIILLTGGSSFLVPENWNFETLGPLGFANKVECLGGGGVGMYDMYTGGGGGAYARVENLTLTPLASASYAIAGVGTIYYQRNSTRFNGASYAASSVAAEGAQGSSIGTAASSIGTVRYSGGAASSGGGGCARPTGNGPNASGSTGGPSSAVLWVDNSGGSNNGLQARCGGGGARSTSWNTRMHGANFGGGGGGGAPDDGTHYSREGYGAQGLIAITYYPYI